MLMKFIAWICLCVLSVYIVTPIIAQKKDGLDKQQQDSFKQKIDQLQKEGKLTELTSGADASRTFDVHYWIYAGELVKMTRRWNLVSAVTFDLPPTIDEVVFSYINGWRRRVISNSAEKALLCEVIRSGSFKRDEREETWYYMDSNHMFVEGDWLGHSEISVSSSPTTLKFFSGRKEILSIEVWYAHDQNSHLEDPVVEKVEKYIVRQKSKKKLDYNFQNPALNIMIEKYSLDITQNLGLKHGK
jgi:hypothetical protein